MDLGSLNLDNLGDIMSSLSEDDMAKLNDVCKNVVSRMDADTVYEKVTVRITVKTAYNIKQCCFPAA